MFGSVAADGCTLIWDVRRPTLPIQKIQAHVTEALSMDWNKYTDVTLVTASVDKTIKGWDLRKAQQPLFILEGHQYAIRRVKCSPHKPNIILSCSYDMTTRLWDTNAVNAVNTVNGVNTINGVNTANGVNGVNGVNGGGGMRMNNPITFNTTVIDEHSEFVVGIDFNLAVEGLIADCAWDETVSILQV